MQCIKVLQDLPISPVGAHVRNASLSSAISLTAPAKAKRLILSVETKNVRITVDGETTATADIGLLFEPASQPYAIDVSEGVVLSIIETEASAVINYQWSR